MGLDIKLSLGAFGVIRKIRFSPISVCIQLYSYLIVLVQPVLYPPVIELLIILYYRIASLVTSYSSFHLIHRHLGHISPSHTAPTPTISPGKSSGLTGSGGSQLLHHHHIDPFHRRFGSIPPVPPLRPDEPHTCDQ